MPRFPQVTGLILAGGTGRRLGGTEKAFLQLNGQTFISRLVELFGRFFGQTLIVTNNPTAYLGLGVRAVRDLEPDRGAIMGLITGLFYAPTEWSFVTACDMPLLKEEVVALVVESIKDQVKVVLPQSSDGLQPLAAAYHQDCRHCLNRLLRQGQFSLRPLFKQVPVQTIGPAQLALVDPWGRSFVNVNTPADLKAVANEKKE
ncbi:MAG: molybdenum cofactor guanylyltransferase [Deltaproteobacteria bacterium]|nr:molybdenum cofactor guanylyltransferase [Deltaproteobacteria bacterium]